MKNQERQRQGTRMPTGTEDVWTCDLEDVKDVTVKWPRLASPLLNAYAPTAADVNVAAMRQHNLRRNFDVSIPVNTYYA